MTTGPTLKAAYVQLLAYKDDLGNPPLLVVGELERAWFTRHLTSTHSA